MPNGGTNPAVAVLFGTMVLESDYAALVRRRFGAGEAGANDVNQMAGYEQVCIEGNAAAGSNEAARTAEAQRFLREAALLAAGKHFTVDEYHQLQSDICAGLVDIRIYEGGLVLMRQPG